LETIAYHLSKELLLSEVLAPYSRNISDQLSRDGKEKAFFGKILNAW